MKLNFIALLSLIFVVGCASEKVEKINLEAAGIILPVRKRGTEGNIKALAFYKNDRMVLKPTFKYFSDNERVIEINENTGKFKVIGSGKTKVKAVMNGVVGELDFVVGIPDKIVLEAMSVTAKEKDEKRTLFPKRKKDKEIIEKTVLTPKDSIQMKMGEKISMNAFVKNENGEVIDDMKVIWKASNYSFTVYQQVVEGAAIGTGKLILTAGAVRSEISIDVQDW